MFSVTKKAYSGRVDIIHKGAKAGQLTKNIFISKITEAVR
jgi:hypothetical protein